MTERTKATGGMPEAIALSAKKNYLGDSEVCDILCRQLIKEVTDRMRQVKTEAEREAAIEADKAACYRYADIFTGQDPDYTPMPYHTGSEIVRHIRKLGVDATTPRDAVAGLLGQLVLTVYDSVGRSMRGKADDTWQYVLDDMIEHCVKALCGMGAGYETADIEANSI